MKLTLISFGVAIILIGGTFLFTSQKKVQDTGPVNNVSIVDGKQVIEIRAKGGYLPIKSTAKAGIPTVLKVDTNGTFDCSSAVRIPSMGISNNLPPSGSTEIDLGNPKVGVLQGTCGMGMYPFEITFEG